MILCISLAPNISSTIMMSGSSLALMPNDSDLCQYHRFLCIMVPAALQFVTSWLSLQIFHGVLPVQVKNTVERACAGVKERQLSERRSMPVGARTSVSQSTPLS